MRADVAMQALTSGNLEATYGMLRSRVAEDLHGLAGPMIAKCDDKEGIKATFSRKSCAISFSQLAGMRHEKCQGMLPCRCAGGFNLRRHQRYGAQRTDSCDKSVMTGTKSNLLQDIHASAGRSEARMVEFGSRHHRHYSSSCKVWPRDHNLL
jgi:hypothetical protein